MSDPIAVGAIMSTCTLELPSREATTARWAAAAFVASYSFAGPCRNSTYIVATYVAGATDAR